MQNFYRVAFSAVTALFTWTGLTTASAATTQAELNQFAQSLNELREQTLSSTDAPGRLTYAAKMLKRGDRAAAARALEAWKKELPASHTPLSISETAQLRRLALRQLPYADAVSATRLTRSMTASLRFTTLEVARLENQIRKQKFISAHLSPRRNAAIDRSTERVDNALLALYNGLTHTGPSVKSEYLVSRRLLQMLFTAYYDALMNRMSTVEEHAELIETAIYGLLTHAKITVDGPKLNALIQRESGEQQLRIWVNRDTVSAVGLSAALVAEAIAIPFSGGTSAAAMPGTLVALQTTLTAGSLVVRVGSSTLNLLDRIQAEGAGALLKLESAVDIITIAVSVRELGGVTKLIDTSKAGPKWLTEIKNRTEIARFAGAIGIDVWAYVQSEVVAKKTGQDASELRAKAATGIATTILFRITGKMNKKPETPPAPDAEGTDRGSLSDWGLENYSPNALELWGWSGL